MVKKGQNNSKITHFLFFFLDFCFLFCSFHSSMIIPFRTLYEREKISEKFPKIIKKAEATKILT